MEALIWWAKAVIHLDLEQLVKHPCSGESINPPEINKSILLADPVAPDDPVPPPSTTVQTQQFTLTFIN